ncbi:hypothetical protein OCH239_14410 [Roseivivax halodurans JCM 10272]|uniref:DUF4440 domain-containing protein n=1 Tax=Roseivivax halodurans JCM 10272 TaxID=1449350 RepID=X7EKL0_9RHOB|nr:DUF4440 domain-containing protein [Roseivivax halodurans]ETX15698.1 hypothetical protein OCH239_14410 [Roseivivax halodurans JCM 10272]
MEEDLWRWERALWLGGADTFQRLMLPEVRMVFPMPGEALGHDAILEAVRASDRWSEVSFEHQTETDIGHSVILTYTAHASRGGETQVIACSSLWTEGDDGLRLVLHQQTPI